MSRAERSSRRKEKWQEIKESWQEFKEELRRDKEEWQERESRRRHEAALRCRRCGGMGQYPFYHREGGGVTWTTCRH